MGLAPQTGIPKSQIKPSGDTTAQKRRARERNESKGSGNSGSTGMAKRVSTLPNLTWEDVKDDMVHLVDIAAKISHTQAGSSGWAMATLNVPVSYVHELLEAHLQSQQGMCFARLYYVPFSVFEQGADDGEQQSA